MPRLLGSHNKVRRIPKCHPERPHCGNGLCKACYNFQYKSTPHGRAARLLVRQRVRAEVLEKYGGAICSCPGCEESHKEFLVIDHINGGGNAHRRANKVWSGTGFYKWLKAHGFPPGFRVLCHNCNMARAAHGICPHEREFAMKINAA